MLSWQVTEDPNGLSIWKAVCLVPGFSSSCHMCYHTDLWCPVTIQHLRSMHMLLCLSRHADLYSHCARYMLQLIRWSKHRNSEWSWTTTAVQLQNVASCAVLEYQPEVACLAALCCKAHLRKLLAWAAVLLRWVLLGPHQHARMVLQHTSGQLSTSSLDTMNNAQKLCFELSVCKISHTISTKIDNWAGVCRTFKLVIDCIKCFRTAGWEVRSGCTLNDWILKLWRIRKSAAIFMCQRVRSTQ